MENAAGQAIELKISHFEGPLDLLFHLIEKNRIDIYDIPVAQVTEQYLDYLEKMQHLDLEIASEFLVMAATLLQIKSRLLLPRASDAKDNDEKDPREELVLRLLEYRRCKAIAIRLQERHEIYVNCAYRLPETPGRLGLETVLPAGDLDWTAFWQACQHVSRVNELRFNDLSSKVTHMLQRERISLRDKMREIWRAVSNKVRVYFSELFPSGKTSRTEKVTGFLALLELMRLNRIRARQDHPFDQILLETVNKKAALDDEALDRFLTESRVEDKEYD